MEYSFTVTGGFHPDDPATLDGCRTTIRGMVLTSLAEWAASNGDQIDHRTLSIHVCSNGDLVFRVQPKKGDDGLSPSGVRKEREVLEFRALVEAMRADLANRQ